MWVKGQSQNSAVDVGFVRVNVFRSRLGDSSNGGLSSRYDEMLLVAEGEQPPLGNTLPVLWVVRRWAGTANEYVHAEPEHRPGEKRVGWMAGGTHVYSSDSRYRQVTGVSYPIQLHDRSETQQQYNENFF